VIQDGGQTLLHFVVKMTSQKLTLSFFSPFVLMDSSEFEKWVTW